MKAHAIIAVRGGPGAKSRCEGRLDLSQRQALVEAMLADMLQALADCPAVGRVYVTTPTPDLARLALRSGAEAILEPDPSDLNQAFNDARRRIADAPASVVALLPGDLPLLDPAELSACIEAARGGAVVLAPASADGGTGAIVHRTDRPLPPAFGPDSFRRHQAAAAELGLPVHIAAAPSLAFDLDRPADLDIAARRSTGLTGELLRKLLAHDAETFVTP